MARKSKIAAEQPEAVSPAEPAAPPAPETAPPEPAMAEAVATPTPAIAAPRRNGLSAIAGAVTATIILAGGATVSWPLWAPRLAALLPVAHQDPFTDTRLIGIADRLAVLEQRLETLPGDHPSPADGRLDELAATQQRLSADIKALVGLVEGLRQSPASSEPDTHRTEDVAAMAARLDAIEQNMRALSNRLSDGNTRPAGLDAIEARGRELTEAVTKLSARVEQVAGLVQAERQAMAAAAPRLDLALAVAGLRQALASSEPFRQELAAVEKALRDGGGDGRVLAAMAANAPRGIPTLNVLRRRFEVVAKDMAHADGAPGGDGWFERLADRVKGLVTVRRIDGADGASGVDAAVSRAEAALAADDLSTAVTALQGLQGKPATAAQDWLEDARARLAAESALLELEARLAGAASGGGGG